MPTISFCLKTIAPLAEHTRQCIEHSATFDQQFDSVYWKDEYIKKGLSEDQVVEMCGKHLDPTKLPSGFWLVKDQGVYLMSNGSPRLTLDDGKRGKVVYAKGYDPERDGDWYSRARAVLGGDDFAIFIPLEWYDLSVSKGKRVLSLRIGARSITLNA